MLKRVLYVSALLLVLLPALFSSCQKEELGAAVLADVAFSCDTMAFDTVFTQMGTTTRMFKVYNQSPRMLRLGSVTLEQGRASRFRLNVDGDTSMVVRNLTIAPGDSIFVFVRANINPNSTTEPFLIEDAVLLEVDGAVKRLPLTAYGRNAIYHVPTDTIKYEDGTWPTDYWGNPYAYSVIDCEHWRHDLPHVILGYAVVDSRSTLHLLDGDELYFYNDAVLWVYDSATLDVRGTAERPVLFTSLRHDGWYDDLPGQWGMIWIAKGSTDSYMEHAVVENATIGVQADSCANANPTLRMSNCQLRNHSLCGLLLNTAAVVGRNLLVTNCGVATVAMQYGGQYDFSGCTFANYWRYDSRKYPSVQISNYRDLEGVRYVWDMQARIQDCIIYGSRAQELLVDLSEGALGNVTLEHSLVRGGEWDEDPKFVDPSEGDYHLAEDSPAQGIGYCYD